ncbi:MAG: IS3 family transposase [Oscillospiraceae bacterium]
MRQRRAYAAIREAHEETGYPIELACKLLHAARSAYHKWASGKLSQRAAENERLADTLEKIHEESPDKGYRRLNDDLRHDHGIYVNDKRVLRICRARDIRSTIKYGSRGCTRHAKIRNTLPKIFWTGSFMPKSPTKSGLPM